MSLNKLPFLLIGRACNAVKQNGARYMATTGLLDMTDAGTAEGAKTLMDSPQKIITREKTTQARKTDEDFKTSGIDDIQDYFVKEHASGAYSAEVQVYDHAKLISDNVVTVQLNKRSKRVFTTTF